MAWNPTPEVGIARDAAATMQEVIGLPVDRCVVLYTTIDGRFGYASYGRTSSLCRDARRLADVAYEAVADQWDELTHAQLPRTDGEVDWDGIATEAMRTLAVLRELWRASGDGEPRDIVRRDVVLPAVSLLARFIACVNYEEADASHGD